MRTWIVGTVVMITATTAMAWAQDAKPPALPERDALVIGRLVAEQRSLVAEHATVMAQAEKRLKELSDAHRAKTDALRAAVIEAAKNSGVDLAQGWLPDPDQKIWAKEQSPAAPAKK